MLIHASHGYSVDPELGVVLGILGKPVGRVKRDGYVYVNRRKLEISAHRLIWQAVHGDIADGLQIDHIDGDKTNNRITNLRAVTGSINCQNRRNARGYSLHRGGKWQASLDAKYIGLFSTEAEARAAYLAAKRLQHAGCTF